MMGAICGLRTLSDTMLTLHFEANLLGDKGLRVFRLLRKWVRFANTFCGHRAFSPGGGRAAGASPVGQWENMAPDRRVSF